MKNPEITELINGEHGISSHLLGSIVMNELSELIKSVESIIDDCAAVNDKHKLRRLNRVLRRLQRATEARELAVEYRLAGRIPAGRAAEETCAREICGALLEMNESDE